MRFIFGVVVGALLVVGIAYVHDASLDSARDPQVHAFVDWPAVSDSMRGVDAWVREQVGWIGDRLRRPG